MSRAGYSEWEGDGPPPEFWERAVINSISGKRGQKFLRDLRDSLDAMPVKRLITGELQRADGEVCSLGAIGVHRNIDMTALLKREDDPDDGSFEDDWACELIENAEQLAKWFDISPALAREVMYQNDERYSWNEETPEARWVRMRKWVARWLGEEFRGS